MRTKRKIGRIISVLLSCVMLIGLLPTMAFAASTDPISVKAYVMSDGPCLTPPDEGAAERAKSLINAFASVDMRLYGVNSTNDSYLMQYKLGIKKDDGTFSWDEPQPLLLNTIYDTNNTELYRCQEIVLPTETEPVVRTYKIQILDRAGNVAIDGAESEEFQWNWVDNTFKVKKTDENDQPLPGAEFTLKGLYDNQGVFPTYTEETDSDGFAVFSGVDNNVYELSETAAPTGYKLSNKKYYISCENGVITVANTVNYSENTGLAIPSDFVPYETVTYVDEAAAHAQITANKTDQDGKPLAGAEFGLFIDEYGIAGEQAYEAVSDENGKIVFNNVTYGSYVLKEVSAPETYLKSDETYHLYIGFNPANPDTPNIFIYDEESPNGREYSPVTFVNQLIIDVYESSEPETPSEPEAPSEPETPSEPSVPVESDKPDNPPTGMNGVAYSIMLLALAGASAATAAAFKKKK